MLLLFDHLTAMFLRAFLHHPCQSVYQEGHDLLWVMKTHKGGGPEMRVLDPQHTCISHALTWATGCL